MKGFFSLILILALSCAALAQAAKPAEQKPSPVQTPAKTEDCGCDLKASPTDVMATVNGTRITLKDIDESIEKQIKELQKQIIDARAGELDLQINSLLLEAEAKKRGISATKLIEQEVVGKAKEPTEAEAQAFYDANKARIQEQFNNIKAEVIAYIRQQRQQEQAKALADSLRAAADIKIISKDVTPPATDADRARVFATVNGKKITSGDIEDSLKPLIYSVQEQVYQMRKQALDIKINDLLLEQEAARKKVTTRSLLDTEVTAKQKEVTETDARKFYDENKARINGEYEAVKPQIIEYLRKHEDQRAQHAYADQLRAASKVEVSLKEPVPPTLQIATADQPWQGGEKAGVTIVEFTDHECPSCAVSFSVIEEVVREYNNRVRWVIREFPLSQHANAFKAAEIAEGAREQGKYFEYVRLVYANQKTLSTEKLFEYAAQAGLDRKKLDEGLASGRYAEEVKKDIQEGNRIGVNSTPSVYINGQRVKDKTKEGLKAAIDTALKEAATKQTASK